MDGLEDTPGMLARFAMNLIVRRPAEIGRHRRMGYAFLREVTAKGIVLHNIFPKECRPARMPPWIFPAALPASLLADRDCLTYHSGRS